MIPADEPERAPAGALTPVSVEEVQAILKVCKYPSMAFTSCASGDCWPCGNTIDRGMGYVPYDENFMFSCGMEVVMPDSEILRTGMGAMPNSKSWQVFK